MELVVVESQPDFIHVSLSGKLDVEGEGQIGTEFEDLTSNPVRDALVDMSNVTYLASLGIRMLFKAAKTLGAEGKKMVVVSPQPMVEETLQTSGTVSLIPIAQDTDAGLSILGRS